MSAVATDMHNLLCVNNRYRRRMSVAEWTTKIIACNVVVVKSFYTDQFNSISSE